MPALRRSLPLAVIGLLAAMPGARAQSWQVEDGSRIGFTVFQQGSPVEGSFGSFSAESTSIRTTWPTAGWWSRSTP